MSATYCPDCGGWLDGFLSQSPPPPTCRCRPVGWGTTIFMQPPHPPVGWRCPVCNRGNAPSVTQCPCKPTTVGDEHGGVQC